MPLRLYADECVDARIVAGLRRRGVDLLTAAEEGLLGAPDATHLDRAREKNRVIVSADRDFLALPLRAELTMGLIFIGPDTAVGRAVQQIARIASDAEPETIAHRVEWV